MFQVRFLLFKKIGRLRLFQRGGIEILIRSDFFRGGEADKYTKNLLIQTQIFSHNISVSRRKMVEGQLNISVGSAGNKALTIL